MPFPSWIPRLSSQWALTGQLSGRRTEVTPANERKSQKSRSCREIAPRLHTRAREARRTMAGRSVPADPCHGRQIVSTRVSSALVVLVVPAPPDIRLVAPLGCAVEPLVHAPEAVHSARIGGIGVVDDAVLEHERADARALADVRGHVGSGHGCDHGDRPLAAGFPPPRAYRPLRLAPVVIFDAPLALLLLGEPDVEVEVEVAAERGRPGNRPPHPPLVRLELRERRPRHR